MEIFDGLEAILTIISEFLYDKAFNKKKKLINRLPYIIIYIIILGLIIFGSIYLGITLIDNNNSLLGFLLLGIAILFIVLLICPFVLKDKR